LLSQELPDYRRGAMGNVQDLGAAHLMCLRVLDDELAQWSSYFEAKITSQAQSDASKG